MLSRVLSCIKAKLKYNFKFPTTTLKLNQQEHDDYIADGILCNVSKDIEKPEMRASLTTEERAIREKHRKTRRKTKYS